MSKCATHLLHLPAANLEDVPYFCEVTPITSTTDAIICFDKGNSVDMDNLTPSNVLRSERVFATGLVTTARAVFGVEFVGSLRK